MVFSDKGRKRNEEKDFFYGGLYSCRGSWFDGHKGIHGCKDGKRRNEEAIDTAVYLMNLESDSAVISERGWGNRTAGVGEIPCAGRRLLRNGGGYLRRFDCLLL